MARPASDISERILQAARERFLVEGVDGASLRAIAKDAGTNLGMIYYYYPSKEELFSAVIEGVYGRVLMDLAQAVGAAGLSTEQRIEKLYAYFAALSDDDIKVVRLLLREVFTSSTRLSRLFERFARGHIPLLLGMMHQGVAKGEVRADQPLLVVALATMMMGLLPQLMRRRLGEAAPNAFPMFPSAEHLAQTLVEIITRGITPPVAPPTKRKSAKR